MLCIQIYSDVNKRQMLKKNLHPNSQFPFWSQNIYLQLFEGAGRGGRPQLLDKQEQLKALYFESNV